jgi:hypothetical protein
MQVLADSLSLETVHASVGMIAWNDGTRSSPLPVGAGFLVRGVHLLETDKGLTLGWRDGNGQRVYIAVRETSKDANGQRRFRLLADQDSSVVVLLAIYGVDEELAIKRQARWHELDCRPEEIPYVIADLQIGDD